ncbi:hypothetical protein MLC59_17785 [Marinobacter bryozoorum]|uniref:hypothetical protein n=1 Tax=Marinobacter bryozoorum TaxID=256324 RepID=UPI002002DC2E|nr:hypothetical protein [Marinobacter bryozoorum]MCK7546014.1 hypothetical protein [Marinobacter bryozoorum]
MSGKFLARLLAITFALSLGACGGGGSSDDDGSLGGPNTGGGSGGEDTPAEDGQEASVAMGQGEGASFVQGQLSLAPDSILAGGTSIVGLSVVDAASGNALLAGEEVSVEFTSRCISSGDATINSPATTTSGLIEVEYQALGCTGQDQITATYEDATAQGVITIEDSDAYSISSNPPSPQSIAPTGNTNSARPSTSTVTFNVIDEDNNPVRGALVEFDLSYSERAYPNVEDVRLDRQSTESGPDGAAIVRVRAGQQNTVVRVIATIAREDGQRVSVVSAPISINSFLPDQDSFSMSISNFMPNAQFHNNETTEITINGGDRFNTNDLEEGNAIVNFVTSGGSIDSYCILDDDGVCTVTWRSTDPRPANGRVAILARTVGDESFRDLNSNNSFDRGEFSPDPGVAFEKGEAYLDYNIDRRYSASVDQFFDDNGNGTYNGPNGRYDGSACLNPSAGSCTKGPVTIWDQGYIVMASDSGIEGSLTATDNDGEYCLTVSATTGAGQPVPLPTDTAINFEITDGEFISTVTSFEIPNTYLTDNAVTYCVYAEEDEDDTTVTRLSATVEPPAPYGGAPIEYTTIVE